VAPFARSLRARSHVGVEIELALAAARPNQTS